MGTKTAAEGHRQDKWLAGEGPMSALTAERPSLGCNFHRMALTSQEPPAASVIFLVCLIVNPLVMAEWCLPQIHRVFQGLRRGPWLEKESL